MPVRGVSSCSGLFWYGGRRLGNGGRKAEESLAGVLTLAGGFAMVTLVAGSAEQSADAEAAGQPVKTMKVEETG